MIESLSGLGFGIIGLAITVGIGIVILASLGSQMASCPTGWTNYTNSLCQSGANASNTTNPSSGTQTVNTLTGYLGTSSGGLGSWVPIIIVLTIGMLFLGYFMSSKNAKRM